MSDIDRPRLALYVALGLVVCFLGARYLRTQVAPAGAAGTAVAAGSAATSRSAPDGAAAPASQGSAGAADATGASGATPTVQLDRAGGGRLTVDVAGAVRHPGVYELPAGSRVNDALRRAGGAARRADLTAVNLAAKLEDGRQVLVPLRAAVAAPAATGAGGSASGGETSATGAGGGVVGAAAPAAPINLNIATLEQLDTLDGVGPGIAQRILDYRQQHGGFSRIEELGEVPGIGDKRFATLKPLVTL
ncbi:MAG TPA: helix-hairpin-helix domain-containing protein [Solirubrobacteraceae bacterium]|jgi:competence protein ComEA|nr:helix-hairpin-helix domain-containing protein [Solirubrobacteraceae bacterium]